MTTSSGTFHRICAVNELPVSEAVRAEIDGTPIALVRTDDEFSPSTTSVRTPPSRSRRETWRTAPWSAGFTVHASI